MQKISIFLIFLLIFFIASGQVSGNNQLEKSIDSLVATQFKPNEPGASIFIAKKDTILYKKAFGSANVELNVAMQPDMVFRIGSITKQFTAIGIFAIGRTGKNFFAG
jgi:CubicO group peptidase (beta-lactamase class C family)